MVIFWTGKQVSVKVGAVRRERGEMSQINHERVAVVGMESL